MDLPRALAPWASLLELFPQELALSLGPLVQRFDLLLGVQTPRSHLGGTEPDGFDGIHRRGSYDRLLLSEWLLADEAPDEFVRRAAMGEHAFLEMARKEPVGARTVVVLFDSGPNQWGSPRIGQLAALIVLARRAEASGANFAWGILQDTMAPWNTTVTRDNVRQLLDSRSTQEVSGSDLRAWQERLQKDDTLPPHSLDDEWTLVGGSRLAPLLQTLEKGNVSLLQTNDVCEPGARQLQVIVSQPGATRPKEIVLNLPEDRLCARLLRDPFEAATVTLRTVVPQLAPASNLLFAFGGTKLLARSSAANTLIAYPIPNSVHAPAGKPRRYRTYREEPIVSVNRVGKSLVAVTLTAAYRPSEDRRSLRLESLNGKLRGLEEGDYQSGMLTSRRGVVPEGDTTLTPCFAPLGSKVGLFALTPDRTLWRLIADGGNYAAKVEAMDVESVSLVPSGLAYVCRLNERRLVITRQGDSTQNLHDLPREGKRSFFGRGKHPKFGLLTYDSGDGTWTIVHEDLEVTMTPPSLSEVVGVSYIPADVANESNAYGLVVIDSDRRSISLLGRHGAFALPRTSSPITTATVSPYDWHIAYATEAGEVFIYSLTLREILYRLLVEEGVR